MEGGEGVLVNMNVLHRYEALEDGFLKDIKRESGLELFSQQINNKLFEWAGMDHHISPIESIFLEATEGNEILSTKSEWQKLTHSLVELGLVTEEHMQCQFQELWDKHQIVFKGRSNNREKIGKTVEPACVKLASIEDLVSQLYPLNEEIDTAIQYFFSSVTKQVNYFQDLLESWDIDRLNMIQVFHLADELHFLNSKLASCIQTEEREYTLLDLLFLAKSIRNCYRVVSGDRNNLRSIHSKANAFVWQRENMSTIDKATRLLTVSEVVLGDHSALVNHQKTGGDPIPIDIWGVCQGYNNRPSQGIGLYKAMATMTSNSQVVSVQAIILSSMSLPYRGLKAIQQCYYAHKQLAAASAVCNALGTMDGIDDMTYMYEYVKVNPLNMILKSLRARGYQLNEKSLVFRHIASEALRCFAKLQEQGTFGIEERITSKNVLVGEHGKYIRLGGIKWGPDLSTTVKHQESNALNDRDLKLGEDFANIIEEMLGLNQSRSELLNEDNVEINMEEDVFQGKIVLNVGQMATLHLAQQSDHHEEHHWYTRLIQSRHHHLGLASENSSILPVQIQNGESSNIVSTNSGPTQPVRAPLRLRAVREGNVELQCFCSPAIGCMASQEMKRITVNVSVKSKPISTGLRILLQCCKGRRYIEIHATGAASVTLTDLLRHGGIEPIIPPDFGALISEFDLFTA